MEEEEAAIKVDAYQKPFFARGKSGWNFNLSHSGQYLLIGFSYGNRIGVDIQQETFLKEYRQMSDYFHPKECAKIKEEGTPKRGLSQFYAFWTGKEAVLKAKGTGLYSPLDSFELRTDGIYGAQGSKWPMEWKKLPAPDGYAAAVAIKK